MRGSLTEPGVESPYRNRSVTQNLELFEKMRAGEFEDGAHVLRAKIDMASGNVNLRDPTLYRIRRVEHARTGDAWHIYPMYDYTHCLSDAIEGVTHSLCTLEFEDHRPLYDWVLDVLETPCHPQQIEFARLSLEHTVLSKRRLIELVEGDHVAGWDDPRMPTVTGLRRRGFTPAALRDFCERIGVTKNDALIEMAVLETCIRDDLNANAPRRMAVLDPLKVVVTSLPEDHREPLAFANHPQDESHGTREVVFTRELYVEREDFAEDPPPKWQRLVEGGEVRLRGSYVIRCDEVVRDAGGAVVELRCSHDPATLGQKPVGRKVKGVVHWVSASEGGRGRGQALRPAVPRPGAGHVGGSRRGDRSGLGRRARGRGRRAEPRRARAGEPGAVRTARVFRRRSRGPFGGAPGVQPDRDAEGHLGTLTSRPDPTITKVSSSPARRRSSPVEGAGLPVDGASAPVSDTPREPPCPDET